MYSVGGMPGSYASPYGPATGPYGPGSVPVLPSAAALGPPPRSMGAFPGAPMPMQSMPMQTMQGGAAPMQSMPMQSMPMQSMPMQSMPMQSMPMQAQSVRQMMPSTGPMASMAPLPPPDGPAWVPASSGQWMPRVSYRMLEGPHEEAPAGEKPFPNDREALMKFVAQQDQEVQDLKLKTKQLRSKHHGNHNEWIQRVEDLEAHVLSAKLKPVADGKDALPPDPPLPPDLVPNGLLQEFADRATALEVLDTEGIDADEEDEMMEQQRLELKSEMLGLPPLAALDLPEGAKIVDIRLVEPGHVEQQMRINRRDEKRNPRPIEPPTLKGRIVDSNYALTPSPYHPVGQFTQMGLLSNMYPIDRAPVSYENIFQATWPGAEEKWYSAYGDYFQARRFPQQFFPEGRWEMDCDKGKPVYNVQWRTTPSGDHMAAVGVDVTGDGFADVVVVGKDKNFDGVPDMLEVPPAQRFAQDICSKIFPY